MAKKNVMTTGSVRVGAGNSATRANMETAGIPDSRPFVAPESEPRQGGADRILACHINGVPVSELGLGPHVILALDYYATDEGIAEKEAHPMARESSGITLGKDGFNKTLDEKRDQVKGSDRTTANARDPLREVADAHAVQGMSPKFMSPRRIQENGGTGDYEVVKDKNGDPVKVRGMVLGHAPVEMVEARKREASERSQQMLKQIGETYKREGRETAVADQ